MPATAQTDTRPPLLRPQRGRRIAGVCAGLAHRTGAPVAVVRLLFLVGTLIPILPGLPVYLLLWWLLPADSAVV